MTLIFDLNNLVFLGLCDDTLFHSRLCRLVSGWYSKIHDWSMVTTLLSICGSVSSFFQDILTNLHTMFLLLITQQPWYHFCTYLSHPQIFRDDVVVVVVVYPTPSEGWGHGGRPWSPRSRATPQGLDQRS